jgi:hypothetical protein
MLQVSRRFYEFVTTANELINLLSNAYVTKSALIVDREQLLCLGRLFSC